MPTGWYVIGATPARLYAPERDESFFVGAGDLIRFEPVDAVTFDALDAREAAGERVALVVEAAGPGITLQDGGRHGYLRYGITAAGPMDPLMHATANRAVGNPLDAAAIEVSTGGLTVVSKGGPLGIAMVSRSFRIALDGAALPDAVAVTLEPGQALTIRAGASGAWCSDRPRRIPAPASAAWMGADSRPETAFPWPKPGPARSRRTG
jgi:hypothetical protein